MYSGSLWWTVTGASVLHSLLALCWFPILGVIISRCWTLVTLAGHPVRIDTNSLLVTWILNASKWITLWFFSQQHEVFIGIGKTVRGLFINLISSVSFCQCIKIDGLYNTTLTPASLKQVSNQFIYTFCNCFLLGMPRESVLILVCIKCSSALMAMYLFYSLSPVTYLCVALSDPLLCPANHHSHPQNHHYQS